SGAHFDGGTPGHRRHLDNTGALRNAGGQLRIGLLHSGYPRPHGVFRIDGSHCADWCTGFSTGRSGPAGTATLGARLRSLAMATSVAVLTPTSCNATSARYDSRAQRPY